jgi:hypothetical protein
VASKLNEKDTFVFRKDSAGLGVPRGTFGKLNHISSGVVQHGSVERPAYVSSISSNGRPQENGSRMATNGTTATHTMPAGSHSSIGTRSNSPGMTGGGSVSGGHSTPSGGSVGGASSSMGGSAGGSHTSGGGHH